MAWDNDRRRFFDTVHDLIPWGNDITEKLKRLYDEPTRGETRLRTEAKNAEAAPSEKEVRDSRGMLMPCVICGNPKTVDGRACTEHYDGPSDLPAYR